MNCSSVKFDPLRAAAARFTPLKIRALAGNDFDIQALTNNPLKAVKITISVIIDTQPRKRERRTLDQINHLRRLSGIVVAILSMRFKSITVKSL